MGESLVEAPKVENKMGDSFTHVPCLQESVSFGRFEHDSLCWERWSTFPTNKYLEEVEKCSTPGSVAQKKAYFEAHYKRIAARKAAELLDQEKKREAESLNSEDQSQSTVNSFSTSSEEEFDAEKSNTHSSVCEAELENDEVESREEPGNVHIGDVSGGGIDVIDEENEVGNFPSEVNRSQIEVQSDGADIIEQEDEVGKFTGEMSDHSADIIEHEDEVAKFTGEMSDHSADIIEQEDEVAKFTGEMSDHIDEANDGIVIVGENKDLQPQPEDAASENLEIKTSEEPVLEIGEAASMVVSRDKEVVSQDKVEVMKVPKKELTDAVKVQSVKKTHKATLAKKTINSTNAKKKPASPMLKRSAATMPRSPMLSTPKPSKPVSKPAMSTIRPSVKKENTYTPLTTKKATRPESKRALPTSLHMSFSLGPANSDPSALKTTRKSLIMESMGDKDIVNRAFRAFQNHNQLSTARSARAPATNQHITKKIEQKASGLGTPQKKKEGISTSVKAAGPHAVQHGAGKTSPFSGLQKTVGGNQNGKSISAFGSRSLDHGTRQKELPGKVPKKAVQNSKSSEVGKTPLQFKVKVEKAVDLKTSTQSLNSKVKLPSRCNQGHAPRGLRKEEAKTKAAV